MLKDCKNRRRLKFSVSILKKVGFDSEGLFRIRELKSPNKKMHEENGVIPLGGRTGSYIPASSPPLLPPYAAGPPCTCA
jgi:hypothetical protein